MTLTEYLSGQGGSQRMPKVVLQPSDYKLMMTVKVGVDTLKLIIIWALNVEYVQKNTESRLYTTDKYGNPKSLSCFHLS